MKIRKYFKCLFKAESRESGRKMQLKNINYTRQASFRLQDRIRYRSEGIDGAGTFLLRQVATAGALTMERRS